MTLVLKTMRYATLGGAENGGTPAATIRESQTMWDAGNLSHDFNILMNSTSFPTNLGITLLGLCTMVKTKCLSAHRCKTELGDQSSQLKARAHHSRSNTQVTTTGLRDRELLSNLLGRIFLEKDEGGHGHA